MNKTAIATMALGRRHHDLFRQCSQKSFRRYAEKIGAEPVVFDHPLDPTAAARGRPPAWQKCLLLDHPRLRDFDQVAWMDSDILINAELAPSIFEQVREDQIGITADVYPDTFPDMAAFAAHYYAPLRASAEGVLPAMNTVIQGGVWIMSPRHHTPLLHKVYRHAGNPTGEARPYEQPAFGFEIYRAGGYRWIDPRFNTIVLPELMDTWRQFQPPFKRRFRFLYLLGLPALFRQSYVLHFAGTLNYLKAGTYLLRACGFRV